jgi:CHAD domain-containing protein
MRRTNQPLSSFDEPWKEFSGAWKKARSEASEKFIHDLRVSTRRLIARLELTRALSNDEEIAAVQKQFKKVLKRMGPLRDVQVQLEGLARFRANGVITDFKRRLKRRENAKIQDIRRDLKCGKRRRLENAITNLRSDFESLAEAVEDGNVRRSIERVVRLRRSEFFKAR